MTPWTVAHQAPLSVAFSRQECWSGWPFPMPGALPDPCFEPAFPNVSCIVLSREGIHIICLLPTPLTPVSLGLPAHGIMLSLWGPSRLSPGVPSQGRTPLPLVSILWGSTWIPFILNVQTANAPPCPRPTQNKGLMESRL